MGEKNRGSFLHHSAPFLQLQKLDSLGQFQELIRERGKVFHCVWGEGKRCDLSQSGTACSVPDCPNLSHYIAKSKHNQLVSLYTAVSRYSQLHRQSIQRACVVSNCFIVMPTSQICAAHTHGYRARVGQVVFLIVHVSLFGRKYSISTHFIFISEIYLVESR